MPYCSVKYKLPLALIRVGKFTFKTFISAYVNECTMATNQREFCSKDPLRGDLKKRLRSL